MASEILLDTTVSQHPRLVVEIPRGIENEIRQLLKTLAQENVPAQTVILDALRVAAEQTYFWTPEWQAKEHATDDAIAAGRVKTFDTMDELLEFLDQE